MNGSGCQKKEGIARGHLRLADGGDPRPARARSIRVFTSAEIKLDAELAGVVGSIRGANGKHPTRGFQRVLYGEAFPWRVLARWFVAARKKRAPKAQLVAVLDRLHRFVDKLYEDAPDLAA